MKEDARFLGSHQLDTRAKVAAEQQHGRYQIAPRELESCLDVCSAVRLQLDVAVVLETQRLDDTHCTEAERVTVLLTSTSAFVLL